MIILKDDNTSSIKNKVDKLKDQMKLDSYSGIKITVFSFCNETIGYCNYI